MYLKYIVSVASDGKTVGFLSCKMEKRLGSVMNAGKESHEELSGTIL